MTVSTTGIIHTVPATTDNSLLVTYLCVEQTGGRIENANLTFSLRKGACRATLMDPRDLHFVATMLFVGPDPLDLPGFSDDLIVKIVRVAEE